MKKLVSQIKKEASEASSQWDKKYDDDTRKHKKENVEMKIQLLVKKIKQVEFSTEHQAFQSAFQCLQQNFVRKKETLMPFVRNTADMLHNEKN